LSRSTVKEPAKGILLEDPISEEGSSEEVPQGKAQASTETQAASGHTNPHLQVEGNKMRKSGPSLNLVKEQFHVFTWLNAFNDAQGSGTTSSVVGARYMSPSTRSLELEEDLKEIDTFLNQKTSLTDRLTYRRCPFQQRTELYKLLTKEGKDITAMNDSTQTQRELYENKVDILNAADLFFQFFLPASFQGPTVGKYWGSLFQLLEVRVLGPFSMVD
jgi:hypothetical protein